MKRNIAQIKSHSHDVAVFEIEFSKKLLNELCYQNKMITHQLPGSVTS